MQIILCRKHSLGSWLIRIGCWSAWSHCAIVDGSYVIDSTLKQGGVRARPLAEFLAEYLDHELVDVACPDDAAGMVWARAQLGKPYDWTAIAGFITRQPLADERDWFCSELVEGAIQAAGRSRFRADLARITPQHVWMVRG